MGKVEKAEKEEREDLEDWTWKDRRVRWKLEEIARMEEKKGNKVWVGYGRIKIAEQWWRWDEEEEILVDGRGNRREGEQEEGLEEEEKWWVR